MRIELGQKQQVSTIRQQHFPKIPIGKVCVTKGNEQIKGLGPIVNFGGRGVKV